MKIQYQLLQPHVDYLKNEFEDLRRKIGFESSDEITELLNYINPRISQLQMLSEAMSSKDDQAEGLASSGVAMAYRKLKLELRFARRRWLRILSTESRIRKIQEKRPNVSTFAA